MSKIQDKIKELNKEGLIVVSDNLGVRAKNDAAEQYIEAMGLYGDTYVIGEMPSANEDITYADYDVIFGEIEGEFGGDDIIGEDLYERMHEKAHMNDIDRYVVYVSSLIEKGEIEEEKGEDFIEDIQRFQEDILEGIDIMINDIRMYREEFGK